MEQWESRPVADRVNLTLSTQCWVSKKEISINLINLIVCYRPNKYAIVCRFYYHSFLWGWGRVGNWNYESRGHNEQFKFAFQKLYQL